MKQLSYRLATLVNRLQTLSVDQKDLFGRLNQTTTGQAVDLINQIAQSGEFLAVIYLVQYLAAQSADVARAAVDAIELLLQDISPELLLQLDFRIRSGTWSVPEHLSRWDDLKYAALQKLFAGDRHVGLLGVASLHRSGYVRQNAVEDLARINSGKELPYLLIRLSDWVPCVRQPAENAVLARIKTDYLQHFVDNLALIEQVKERQRHPGENRRLELIERIYRMLQLPANFDLLLSSLNHQNLAVRRICLRLLLGVPEPEIALTVPHVIHNGDIVIRRQAVGLALRLGLQEQRPALEELVCDYTPSIRLAALRALCTDGGAPMDWRLKHYLLDRSAMVRQFAVWQVATLDPTFDFREFYIQSLEHDNLPQVLASAIAGLGESGKPGDGQLVMRYIEHPQLVVQKSAIKALAKLDIDHHTQSFLLLLASSRPAVSCVAQKALAQTKNLVSGSVLLQILVTSNYWHVKRNALRLIDQLEKWDRICHLLLAAAQSDQRVQEQAICYIESCARQYQTSWQYTCPTTRQKELLATGLQQVGNVISSQLRQELDRALRVSR